jgi:RHS repeat-associated protein
VTLLTDARSLIAAKYKYDAFGQTISATGSAADLNRYRFSTKPIEWVSGLAFFGYRYYDPKNGRWPSRDPIGEKGGINLFGFVGNDSISRMDKLGLTNICPEYYGSRDGDLNGYSVRVQFNLSMYGTTESAGNDCCLGWQEGWSAAGFSRYSDCVLHLHDEFELPELLDNAGDVSGAAGTVVAGVGYASAGAGIGLLGAATGGYQVGNLIRSAIDCGSMQCVIQGSWKFRTKVTEFYTCTRTSQCLACEQ